MSVVRNIDAYVRGRERQQLLELRIKTMLDARSASNVLSKSSLNRVDDALKTSEMEGDWGRLRIEWAKTSCDVHELRREIKSLHQHFASKDEKRFDHQIERAVKKMTEQVEKQDTRADDHRAKLLKLQPDFKLHASSLKFLQDQVKLQPDFKLHESLREDIQRLTLLIGENEQKTNAYESATSGLDERVRLLEQERENELSETEHIKLRMFSMNSPVEPETKSEIPTHELKDADTEKEVAEVSARMEKLTAEVDTRMEIVTAEVDTRMEIVIAEVDTKMKEMKAKVD